MVNIIQPEYRMRKLTFAGPFLLTHLLLDKVVESGGDSRIVHVSSDAHLTKFDFEGDKSRVALILNLADSLSICMIRF